MRKILSFMLLSTITLSGCGSTEKEIAKVSKEEYKKIKTGMTYEEVEEIVGGAANKENKIDDNLIEYTYSAEDGIDKDASVSILFKNDSVDTLTETGLLKEESEDDRKLLHDIDYEVTEDNDNQKQNAKYIQVKLPDTKEYVYTFSAEDVAKYIIDKYKNDGYDAIWINIHAANDENMMSARSAYTQKGLAMTGADKVEQIVTD
ncbi:hypothetical protein [Bacillus sp. Hm123]|uniref:hypothetical protein n=1 Tax=Bacillus sp. Hm123 TaxID=3450745 RepID=UPI003F442146